MLTGLKIKKFRGLNELSLTNASRINLIVGRNDTGKTSLLEAIRLLLSGDKALAEDCKEPNRAQADGFVTGLPVGFLPSAQR